MNKIVFYYLVIMLNCTSCSNKDPAKIIDSYIEVKLSESNLKFSFPLIFEKEIKASRAGLIAIGKTDLDVNYGSKDLLIKDSDFHVIIFRGRTLHSYFTFMLNFTGGNPHSALLCYDHAHQGPFYYMKVDGIKANDHPQSLIKSALSINGVGKIFDRGSNHEADFNFELMLHKRY